VQTLQTALDEALKAPALRQKLEASGSTVVSRQPELRVFMTAESAKFKRMAEVAKIEP
jgi:hypothetical protein